MDLLKNLDQITADEEVAADDHETMNKENEIVNTMSADNKEFVQCFRSDSSYSREISDGIATIALMGMVRS